MQRYEQYKDSGVEWIGQIPKDWKIKKLGKIGCFSGAGIDKKINPDEPFVNMINYTDVYGNDSWSIKLDMDFMRVTCPKNKLSECLVEKGDLIFTPSSETIEDIGVSALVEDSLKNTVYSYHVLRYRTDKVSFMYKKYLCNNAKIQQYFSSRAVGSIRKTLNRSDFKNTPVIIPPLSIQTAIAKHLDRKIAQIVSLIEDKQNLITVLKEKRQSIISEAVTKGINKNVPMKDSGVEWIGKVPQHWEVKRLKRIFEIVKRLYYQLDRSVLSVTQRGLKIKDLESNDGQHAETYAGYQVVNVNDFAMNSMDLLTGYVDCSVFEGVTSPDYRVFRFWKNKIQSHSYYKHLFQMCYKNKIFYGYGQGVSNLGRWRLQTEVFLNFLIPQPPLQEQIDIAKYIDNKTTQLDSIISEITNQIEKLKEYRQSIISEAVTGKVKIEDNTEGGLL